jgi:hypothetical protein
LDVYYLRKKLDAKPQLNATVTADLPAECALASDGADGLELSFVTPRRQRRSSSSSLTPAGGGGGTGSTTASAVTDAVMRNLQESREKLQESREKFHESREKFHESREKLNSEKVIRWKNEEARRNNEEARRQKEIVLREKEITFNEREDGRRQKEDERRARKVKFDEWTSMKTSIRELRLDMCNSNFDEDSKAEMKRELDNLKKRKLQLGVELGIEEY